MADKLTVTVGLVAASARLPGTSQENQELYNAGPGTVYLGQAGTTYLTGCPFPAGSKVELIKNAVSLFACTGPKSLIAGGSPAVPASTTPQNNTTGLPVVVTVSGGTVSAVAVGGVTQSVNGVNQTSGAFIVPAGSSITLTYTVVPTWTWQWGDTASLLVSPGVQAT